MRKTLIQIAVVAAFFSTFLAPAKAESLCDPKFEACGKKDTNNLCPDGAKGATTFDFDDGGEQNIIACLRSSDGQYRWRKMSSGTSGGLSSGQQFSYQSPSVTNMFCSQGAWKNLVDQNINVTTSSLFLTGFFTASLKHEDNVFELLIYVDGQQCGPVSYYYDRGDVASGMITTASCLATGLTAGTHNVKLSTLIQKSGSGGGTPDGCVKNYNYNLVTLNVQ